MDCHMHMILDGYEWKGAIARHKEKPDEDFIRQILTIYRDLGYTYLRDGGDRWNAGKRSRELAKEYGITHFSLWKAGGNAEESLRNFVRQ